LGSHEDPLKMFEFIARSGDICPIFRILQRYNRNHCDDPDDRDHDEEFDEGKTSFVHVKSSIAGNWVAVGACPYGHPCYTSLIMRLFYPRASQAQQFRNFIFGVEDSLVSTVGVLSGIAFADVPRATIFLTGVVVIFVEAFSMGVGSYLSERSGAEFLLRKEASSIASIPAAILMFVGYFFAGFVPLLPYMLLPVAAAFPISIASSILALFLLGIWGGSISRTRIFRNGARMAILGGLAIMIGMIVGALMKLVV
jgi:VIT1/CCC1 family predicted Fe2+/Mn2+ transporter